MTRHSLLFSLALLAPAALPPGAPAQSAKAVAETFAVDGSVVNSATGEAIRGALVQGFVGKPIAVLTGADGKFRLEKVHAGQITLTANKPGYFSEHDLSSLAVFSSFPVGPDSPPVILRLVPEGVIFGRVTDEDGEPAFLPVKVLAFHILNGRKKIEEVFSGFSNDEGEFRAANLHPGTYYVVAGPSQSSVRKKDSSGRAREMGVSGEFYPGVADFAGATAIQVAAGTVVRADISLAGQPFFEISGRVSGYPEGSFASVQLMDTSGKQLEQGYEFDAKTGLFRMHAPGGVYELQATAQDAAGRSLSARRKITVQADTTGVRLTLVPATDIAVHVRLDAADLQQAPQPLASVTLVPTEGSLGNAPPSASSEGPDGQSSVVIRNVLPGNYAVDITPIGLWYVESARCGSTDLLRGDLVVAASAPSYTIEITMRGDVATLEATIAGDNVPNAVSLLLVPENGATRVVNVYRQPDSTFETQGLPPGRYKVLAVDRMDDLEYANREAIEPLLAKAQEIALQPGKKTAVKLELIRRKP